MIWQVEVKEKDSFFDAQGEAVKKDFADFGIRGVKDVRVVQLYFIDGEFSKDQIRKIAREILTDRITQYYVVRPVVKNTARQKNNGAKIVEVFYNPGVMDPWEESVKKAITDFGFGAVTSVKTAKRYLIKADISSHTLALASEKLLYNKVIQNIKTAPIHLENPKYEFRLKHVNLSSLEEKGLVALSRDGQLFLSLKEMLTIQEYFKSLGRNPTDCELETIAQTWSEHCGHKTFRGIIEYTAQAEGPRKVQTTKINNLLKSTIIKVTSELNKKWCISVFKDNAGIIEFDDKYNVCFKVETHNHPSALEPYGGAGTGTGGVIRDILGVGLGAKPIMNTDVFCFAPPDMPLSKIPKGMLHPRRIMKGVVSGVRDYGNRMGIPTANGAVLFDRRYAGNPLVYCGTVGIMPKSASFNKVQTGDLVVLVGGRTGRDGIHGATFSSGELTHESEVISSGAVQIGNPITEKKITDTLLLARDKRLYNAITDCGGGGLSSAVGEMGKSLGVAVDLEKVPLKYDGLSYTEIWISEAQERMILAVPGNKIDELIKIFEGENVEVAVIGEFTDDKKLRLRYNGTAVCGLDMEFLHEGLPRVVRKAVWKKPKHREPSFTCPKDMTGDLLKLLSSYNTCSKEWIIRQYDHEVQGQSVLKPLVGIANDGPSDAVIIRPVFNSKKGIVVGCGINFRFSDIDPYWMAASSIDEAIRQIVAVGGSPDKIALLDNFCWGDTDKQERLGELVRAAQSCYDMAKAFETPFISGKDSLHNEYKVANKTVSIPGTLLISAISVMDDVSKAVSMDAKKQGNLIYVIGETFDELGGSEYFSLRNVIGNSCPGVNPKNAKKLFERVHAAVSRGLIRSCHDVSEGGLGVALAETAFSGGLGMTVFLKKAPYKVKKQSTVHSPRSTVRDDYILFSESNSRFIAEVEKHKQEEFETLMQGMPVGLVGCLSASPAFTVYGIKGNQVVSTDIRALKEAWQKPLRW
ncbi:MAG: phosphoribosylformylglycinamidine synthase subunit PurL [Candidatus Omnitrophota bacterium]